MYTPIAIWITEKPQEAVYKFSLIGLLKFLSKPFVALYRSISVQALFIQMPVDKDKQ